MNEKGSSDADFLVGLALVCLVFASWITHVVVCLKTSAWGFLVAGAILAPIGVIHGFGIWSGAW